MILGEVNGENEAVVPLALRGAGASGKRIEAVVDTGFDGYLALPPDAVAALKLDTDSYTLATLADGSTTTLPRFRVQLQWGERWREVIALGVEGDPLVGMAVLKDHVLAVDVRNRGPVSITGVNDFAGRPCAVYINFWFEGLGWSRCELRLGTATANMTASWSNDAPGDLARAAVGLLDGEDAVAFGLTAEPGQYRWDLDKRGDILYCRITWDPENRTAPKVLVDTACQWSDFLTATCLCLERVLRFAGLEGYRDAWGYRFPVQEFARIHAALGP